LIVSWCRQFLFFVVPHQFSQVAGEWPENQILIPNWTYFHCPGATLSNEYKDVVDKVTVIDSNVSTLQSYTVSKGTSFGVGLDVFQDFTSGTQNSAIGNWAGGGTYGDLINS